jgi:GT2 family glycosyltransferase
MSAQHPTISVVIVTWNCKALTEECLTSLAVAIRGLNAEVVVCDNASSDGTPEMVAEQFPWVHLIRNERNVGFSRGNNVGIRQTRGDYVCLINPDVHVHPDCLRKMMAYMEQEPRIGLLGPKMIDGAGIVRRSTMRFPTLWNTLCRAIALDSIFKSSQLCGGALMWDFKHDTVRDVDVLAGWFWMARRAALSQVGLLDERLFMYGDDLDWCRRYHAAGWRVVFYPGAESIHYRGGTTARAPIGFAIAQQRARLQYWQKHHNWFAALSYRLLACLHHLIRVAAYALVFPLKHSSPSGPTLKLKQSAASVLWLLGLRIRQLGEPSIRNAL